MHNSLPYKVSYSDGNERCTKCSCIIRASCIQIAIMMQSDDEDCQYPEWYHQLCFFKTRLPQTEAAFDGFALLRYTDQLTIRDELGMIVWETEASTEKVPDFGIEYAKKCGDLCAGCEQMIQRTKIRILKVVHLNGNKLFDGKATWYHVLCFARLRRELNWLQSAESLPGFNRLFEEDKEMIKNYIPLMKRAVIPTVNKSVTELAELENQIRIQNKEYYDIYEQLAENVSEQDQIDILNANLQMVPENKIQILHHLTDIIYFGALGLCERCGLGQLIFNNTIYICSNVGGWDKCDYEVKEPLRLPVTIPPQLLIKYPYLNSNGPVRTRVLHSLRTIDEHGNDLVYGSYKEPPLFNMEFVIVGDLTRPRNEIERTVKKMGGKIAPNIHIRLTAVISNENEVRKMSEQICNAKLHNIQVVPEAFLTDVAESNIDPILYIISHNICEWGGDPLSRIEKSAAVINVREPEYYTKSMPKVVTYKWNGKSDLIFQAYISFGSEASLFNENILMVLDGNEVDPECGLNENAIVCRRCINQREIKYSVILGLVDIQNNKNSYYRMQLLKSIDYRTNLYWVFESWGRISTVIGSKRLTTYGSIIEAMDHFHANYEEKTGHPFGITQFYKRPGKFYHLDVDFDVVKKLPGTFVRTKLSDAVYQLMEMLFDTKQMESMMIGCDLDLKQMPLGKISTKQIQLAMTTLKEISCLIQQNGTIGQLREASNRFYTLIPHACSVDRPPIIDSIVDVNAKNEMLESLLNMELIYGFLNAESGEKINPMDACYQKLKADIIHVDKNSTEFMYLCEMVRNTHGRTHTSFTLEVLDVFKVTRYGENERFPGVRNLQNHALLWHGSRLMNFVSILTNGLKIAPPEAPHTGYMFGKGIYFADVVTKSANYCSTSGTNNTGLMLLCEVALGNMNKLRAANHNIKNVPNNKWQSTGGVGMYCPMDWRVIDGITAPFGNIQQLKQISSLIYNEYIVYDPAQVKIKYLFKMKFNYK